MVDALASGASEHLARGGSSPLLGTRYAKKPRIAGLFLSTVFYPQFHSGSESFPLYPITLSASGLEPLCSKGEMTPTLMVFVDKSCE